MQIPINKDFEEEYKNEWVKGFRTREFSSLILAGLAILGVTVFLWRLTDMGPDICVYVGVPFGLPILLWGFLRFQGLTLEEYIRERIYDRRTRILSYDADELPGENRVFTMERERTGKQNRRRR